MFNNDNNNKDTEKNLNNTNGSNNNSTEKFIEELINSLNEDETKNSNNESDYIQKFKVLKGTKYEVEEIDEDEYEKLLEDKNNQTEAINGINAINKNDIKTMKEFLKYEEGFGGYVSVLFKYNQPAFEKIREMVPKTKANSVIVRFMVLAAYEYVNGNGKNKNVIKKSMYKDILDTTSKNSINETHRYLLECGCIKEDENGFITTNEEYVIYGDIKQKYNELKKEDKDYTYTRMFCQTILDLYYNTEPKQRKKLANLFWLLPFINFKYNRLCSNQLETDNLKVQPLSWTDLCRIVGCDVKNVSHFRKDLKSLRIYDRCLFLEVINKDESRTIIINPRVFYKGNKIEDLKAIIDLFDSFEAKRKDK